jgi:hypothetical protein
MWRSTAIDLGDGSLVYSPLPKVGDAERAEVAPVALLAPNHYHNLGLAHWKLPAHASALARVRLARQTPVAVTGLEALEARLPPNVSLLLPAGTRNGEVWLRVAGPDGVTWIVGDAFFNIGSAWTLWSSFLRATLGAPGLAVGQTFLWVGLADRPAYGQWVLEQLLTDRPVRIVPCHGAVAEGPDLASTLRQLVLRRVGV